MPDGSIYEGISPDANKPTYVKQAGNVCVFCVSFAFSDDLTRPPAGRSIKPGERSGLRTVAKVPTESEWEMAARAGSDAPDPWGGNVDPTQANYGQHYRDTTSVVL